LPVVGNVTRLEFAGVRPGPGGGVRAGSGSRSAVDLSDLLEGAVVHVPVSPAAVRRTPITGGARLALSMGLRARGLRGLDVLRRSRDRAPPGPR
jgi:hypothetical protein